MACEIRTFLCRADNIGALLHDPDTGATAVIDVPDAAPVLAALAETGWTLSDILITHSHFDHIAGVSHLRAATGARVTAPARAAATIAQIDHEVSDGDLISMGALTMRVWETPGHCDDHVAYWLAGERAIFVGDTLFAMGCGRVISGTPEQLFASVERILALPDETRLWCGHEYTLSNARFAASIDPDNPALKARIGTVERLRERGDLTIPTTVGLEKATNPFARTTDPDIMSAIGMAGAAPVDVFVELRARKNAF